MLIEPQKSEKAIKVFSFKVMRRLRAAGEDGRAFSLEDIQQECRIAWIIASQNYQAESGVPFQAYLIRGMRLHINRLIEKQFERRREEAVSLSLDADVSNDGDNSSSLSEVIADESISDITDFEEDQHFAYVTRKLKPRSLQFIQILREQPAELLREVRSLRDRSDYARESMGINSPQSNRLAASNIFDLMGANNSERTEILREIRSLGERVCKALSK